MDKPKIRKKYLLKRRQLSSGEALSKSELISQQLQSSTDWQSIRLVHVYQSQADLNEVDTSQIIEFIRKNQPQIILTIGNVSPAAPLPVATYDLVLVPIVAFDVQLNRLGFGGGWYDRFLATQSQATTIGLAYDFQEYEALPTEPHDVRLSRIITEARVF